MANVKFIAGKPVYIAKATVIDGRNVAKGEKVTNMDEETFKTLARCGKIDPVDPYKPIEDPKPATAPKP